jgi:uncharacterized membrane protein YkvA (DUF1232 family)
VSAGSTTGCAGIVARRPVAARRATCCCCCPIYRAVAALLRDERVPVGGKALAVLGVGYVLSPLDVLPTLFFGPIGLIDDLFIVAAALSRVLNYVHPDVVRSHWSGQGDALDAIQRVTEWSETQCYRCWVACCRFAQVAAGQAWRGPTRCRSSARRPPGSAAGGRRVDHRVLGGGGRDEPSPHRSRTPSGATRRAPPIRP